MQYRERVPVSIEPQGKHTQYIYYTLSLSILRSTSIRVATSHKPTAKVQNHIEIRCATRTQPAPRPYSIQVCSTTDAPLRRRGR